MPLYSLWLIPSPDHFRRFSAMIQSLAHQYGTPVFAPHVTLCSGALAGSWATLEAQLGQLCQEWYSVSLGVHGIDQTEAYSQFLFVALHEENEPSIFHRAVQVIPDSHLPLVGPHLSLMYSDPTSEIDRAKIGEEIREQLPERVLFSAVQVVSPGSGHWRDVESWYVRRNVPLGV